MTCLLPEASSRNSSTSSRIDNSVMSPAKDSAWKMLMRSSVTEYVPGDFTSPKTLTLKFETLTVTVGVSLRWACSLLRIRASHSRVVSPPTLTMPNTGKSMLPLLSTR